MTITPNLPVALIILDGWGIGPDYPGNAVQAARTPVMDRLLARYPCTQLRTSGLAVGLPEGQMGNSEVGHLNLGAGFVVYQWISRIDKAIEDGSFSDVAAFNTAIDHCLAEGKSLHLIGLVGDGGVHSHSRHFDALLDLAASRGLRRVFIHAFTDGRDTAPDSALGHVLSLQDRCQRRGTGRIASICGRYFAMDRDQRWDRTRKAYECLTLRSGHRFTSAAAAIENAYRTGVTDEFIEPCHIVPPGSEPVTVLPGDSVIMVNFRADRMRQITRALATPNFADFEREVNLSGSVSFTTMTRYQQDLSVDVAFAPHDVEQPLARVISEAGLKQFHAAETEKYAHVTFFFNGGREEPFAGEDRHLEQSPKIATYDLQPEMSAAGVASAVVDAINSGNYAFVVVNFANCDMVGHTGNFAAAVAAVETVDRCLGSVLEALAASGGLALVTADHGNCEEMIDQETGATLTAHTTNPVSCVLVAPDDHPLRNVDLIEGGALSNVAPTILDMLGLSAPGQMTEASLLLR